VKVLVDINVVLDVALDREPWVAEAAPLLSLLEKGDAEGFVAGHTITTLYYIVAKAGGSRIAARAVTDLLRIADVVPLAGEDFHQALVLGMNDFEDAVQVAAAMKVGADFLVTRNESDFRDAPVQVIGLAAALALIQADDG
jgi:predicted nucleic acid-binding protein